MENLIEKDEAEEGNLDALIDAVDELYPPQQQAIGGRAQPALLASSAAYQPVPKRAQKFIRFGKWWKEEREGKEERSILARSWKFAFVFPIAFFQII